MIAIIYTVLQLIAFGVMWLYIMSVMIITQGNYLLVTCMLISFALNLTFSILYLVERTK